MERSCERCGTRMRDDGSAVSLCPECLIGLGLDAPFYDAGPAGSRPAIRRNRPAARPRPERAAPKAAPG